MRLVGVALLTAACATAVPPIVEEPSLEACDARVLDLNRRLCAEQGLGFTGPTAAKPCGTCGEPRARFTPGEVAALERAEIGAVVGLARPCGCNTCTQDYRKVSPTRVEPLGTGQMTLVACPSVGPPERFK